ncbi:MAG: hypothetical protein CME06_11265 [Gemmatimonadetes bacterium]|nr:hypothetical protein [Gemmatimonadota bacterium]
MLADRPPGKPRRRDTLDLGLIRHTLGLLERALDRSDLLAELDRVVRQVARECISIVRSRRKRYAMNADRRTTE